MELEYRTSTSGWVFAFGGVRGFEGDTPGAIFAADESNFRRPAGTSGNAVRRRRTIRGHTVKVRTQSFLCERAGLGAGGSDYHRRTVAQALPAIHECGTCGTRVFRKLLSLAADHRSKTIRRSRIASRGLHEFEAHQQH